MKPAHGHEKVHYVAQTTFILDKSRYSDLKPIGKGSYGVVCSATDHVLSKRVAIKKITPISKHLSDAKHVLREIRLMRHLGKHENVVSLEDLVVREASDELYIVMELLDTDLHRVIQSKQTLTEAHFRHFFFQLLCGVKYLHAHRIIHRDLKPGNLLVTRDCRLRITDFGLARERNTTDDDVDEPMTEHVVTRWFRPPELMLCPDGLYTYAVDMWSCGCILGEMLGRAPMFPGKNFVHQLQLIFEVIGSPRPSQVAHITNGQARKFLDSQAGKKKMSLQVLYKAASPAALAMVDGLLAFEPEERWTVDEALGADFVRDVVGKGSASERYPPTAPSFEFAFERANLSKTQLVGLIQQEAVSFRRERYGGGGEMQQQQDRPRPRHGSAGRVGLATREEVVKEGPDARRGATAAAAPPPQASRKAPLPVFKEKPAPPLPHQQPQLQPQPQPQPQLQPRPQPQLQSRPQPVLQGQWKYGAGNHADGGKEQDAADEGGRPRRHTIDAAPVPLSPRSPVRSVAATLLGALAETHAVLKRHSPARSPARSPAERPEYRRDRADLQALLTTATAAAQNGTIVVAPSPVRSPAPSKAARPQAWVDASSPPSPAPPASPPRRPPAAVSAAALVATDSPPRNHVPPLPMSPPRSPMVYRPPGGAAAEAAAAALRLADAYLAEAEAEAKTKAKADPNSPTQGRRRRNTYDGTEAAAKALHHVPATARDRVGDDDHRLAAAARRDSGAYGAAAAAAAAAAAEATEPAKKLRQVTQPKSPKFSKMSWERRAEAGAGADRDAERERERQQRERERERDRERERERQEKDRERAKKILAAPVQSSLLRPTASWKAGYGQQQQEVAPAKPRAASAGVAALRQRQSKHTDADFDDDAIEDGLRMLRVRRK